MNPRSWLGRLYSRAQDLSVRSKLLVAMIVAVSIPLTLLTAMELLTRYTDTVAGVEATLDRDLTIAATFLNNSLDSVELEVFNSTEESLLYSQTLSYTRTIYDNPEATVAPSLARPLLATMGDLLQEHAVYRAVRLLSPDGHLLLQVGAPRTTPSILMPSQEAHPAYLWIQENAPSPDNAFILPPYADPQTGNMTLEAGRIFTRGETPLGYLIFTLDANQVLGQPLSAVQQSAATERFLQAEYLFLTDGEGRLLAHTPGITPTVRQVDIQQMVNTGSTRYQRNWGTEPEDVIGRYFIVETLGWVIVAEVPVESVIMPIILSLLATVAPIFMITLLVTGFLILVINRQLVVPLIALTYTARQFADGDFDIRVPETERQDEIGMLADTFTIMASHLREAIQGLEERVKERTRDVELTVSIGREMSALQAGQDIDALLDRTVNLIVDSFPAVYHAQVFLVDPAGEYAELIASTGEPGRLLLQRGHKLAVGSLSVIGQVTEHGQPVVARDTSTSRVHRRNEFLPDTRAELALPLMRGNRVLGALDIQSKQADAFTADQQRIFETLAAQLAVAIDNARLFEEARRRARETESLNRLLARQAWQELLYSTGRQGKMDAVAGPAPDNGRAAGWSEWQREAARRRDVVVSPPQEGGYAILAAPISARGEVIGAVEWRIAPEQATENTRQMARQLTSRLATTLEMIRLLERSEQLATRERLVNQISGKLTAEPNIDMILKTAVEELATILNTPQVSIQLKRPNGSPDADPTESA